MSEGGGEPEMDFWRKAKLYPQASSKPQRLEKEAIFTEVKHFCECLEAFLMDGYSGEIPQQAIKYQLQPLINAFWWQTLIERGIEKIELATVMTEITRLGSEFNPLHARRLEAFAVKRGGDDHCHHIQYGKWQLKPFQLYSHYSN